MVSTTSNATGARRRTVGRAIACLGLAAAAAAGILAWDADRRESGVRASPSPLRGAMIFPATAVQPPEGLVLVLPCTDRYQTTQPLPDGRSIVRAHSVACDLALAPQRLDIAAELEAEPGAGDSFSPAYRLRLQVEGMFAVPPASTPPGARRTWGVPQLALGIADVAGLRGEPVLEWNGTPAVFEPGAGSAPWQQALHAEVPLDPMLGGESWFTLSLELVRTERMERAPSARAVLARMRWSRPHAASVDAASGWHCALRQAGGAGQAAGENTRGLPLYCERHVARHAFAAGSLRRPVLAAASAGAARRFG